MNLYFHILREYKNWVVGMINAESKEIRLHLVDNRNANILKTIIEKMEIL